MSISFAESNSTRSKHLVIIEGPDGAGKTSLIKSLTTGSFRGVCGHYARVHFGPLPRVGNSLGRIYMEAMQPALMGYQPMIFDRSWLSEPVYGSILRAHTRLSRAHISMLGRVAMRCNVTLVLCLPPKETAEANYAARASVGGELVSKLELWREIYDAYARLTRHAHAIPASSVFCYDYTRPDAEQSAAEFITQRSSDNLMRHTFGLKSAGNMRARIAIVGESFAEIKNTDSLLQFPFVSFGGGGCSSWVTDMVLEAGHSEPDLFWVNSDQDPAALKSALAPRSQILCLGAKAYEVVKGLNLEQSGTTSTTEVQIYKLEHPAYWSRFRRATNKDEYGLVRILKEIMQ